MFWLGSLISHVLQWTQFWALICNLIPSPDSTGTYSYTPGVGRWGEKKGNKRKTFSWFRSDVEEYLMGRGPHVCLRRFLGQISLSSRHVGSYCSRCKDEGSWSGCGWFTHTVVCRRKQIYYCWESDKGKVWKAFGDWNTYRIYWAHLPIKL